MNLLLGHAFEQICHSAHLAIFWELTMVGFQTCLFWTCPRLLQGAPSFARVVSNVASSITGRTSRQKEKVFLRKTMRDKLAEANIIVRPRYVFGKLDEAERARNFNPWLSCHQPDRASLGVSRHEAGPFCPAPKQCSYFFHGIVAGGNIALQCGRFRVACTLLGSGR